MIEALGRLLDDYPGDPNRARCFNHVIALVAKRMVRQFDVPKAGADEALDEAEEELRNLAEGIDIEELMAKSMQDTDDEDGGDNANNDDSNDEMEIELSAEDQADLDVNTRPIRLLLVKVSIPVVLRRMNLIMSEIASEDLIRDDQLDYHFTATVVPDVGKTETRIAQDATRCSNAVELHFRHASVCAAVPSCYRRYRREQDGQPTPL